MTKIQNFKMYIDGQWVDSETGRTIETLNPENNEIGRRRVGKECRSRWSPYH